MYCPIVAALNSARDFVVSTMTDKSVPVDRLLVTDVQTMPNKARQFLESRGVTLSDVHSSPSLRKMAEKYSGSHYYNMLKVSNMWNTNYSAILYGDFDQFLFSGQMDVMSFIADHPSLRIITSKGAKTPVNGGLVIVKPEARFEQVALKGMEHGFTNDHEGWGGNYNEVCTARMQSFVELNCKWHHPDDCCLTGSKGPWCFAAAAWDQGFLWHMRTESGTDVGMELNEVPGLSLSRRHYTLNPKPWQLDREPEGPDAAQTTANRLDFFVGTYPSVIRSLAGDQQCTPLYEDMSRRYYDLRERKRQASEWIKKISKATKKMFGLETN